MKLLKKKIKNNQTLHLQPKDRGMYMWTALRAGDAILYVDSSKDCHNFIYFPHSHMFHLSFEDFDKAIKQGILEYSEQLPEEIFKETVDYVSKEN